MTEPRTLPALILAASVAVLGGAFLFEYVGGLAPCVLCIYQRYPYGVAIALSAAAFFVADRRARGALLVICGLAFLAGAAIAAFHVGVEKHWWEGTAACTGEIGPAGSLEELRAQIMAAPVVRCDRVAWSLFGISMAGYNLLISLLLAAVSVWAARRTLREERQ